MRIARKFSKLTRSLRSTQLFTAGQYYLSSMRCLLLFYFVCTAYILLLSNRGDVGAQRVGGQHLCTQPTPFFECIATNWTVIIGHPKCIYPVYPVYSVVIVFCTSPCIYTSFMTLCSWYLVTLKCDIHFCG